MKLGKISLVALGMVAMVAGLTVEARADGGSFGLAPCETSKPKGSTINGTASLERYSDNSFDVMYSAQFDGKERVFRAHFPSNQIDTQSIMHAVCSALQSLPDGQSSTLESQILSAYGFPNRTLHITKRSVAGHKAGGGLVLDLIPGTSTQSALADVTLYAE